MAKMILFTIAAVATMMQLYLANGQVFTSCIYDSATCSGNTNLGRLDLNNATQSGNSYYYIYDNSGPYYWTPCVDFNMGNIFAGMIQQINNSATYQDDGVHQYASCDVQNGAVRFILKSQDQIRFSYIQCTCGTMTSIFFSNENPPSNFNFQLTSTACCPISGGGTDITVTIGVGSIMVIIFFSVLIGYFLFGTIFQVAVRKAQGRDMVPNIAFWSTLPGIIKDGVVFIFTCGRRSAYTEI